MNSLFSVPSTQRNPPVVVHAEATPGGDPQPAVLVEAQNIVLHLESVPPPSLELVIEMGGVICPILLNNTRLTEAQQDELRTILEKTAGEEINVSEKMNEKEPSTDTRRAAELIEIALGQTIRFKEEKRTFVVKGSFLKNYVVDGAFRDKATVPLSNDEKICANIQYNCVKQLPEFARNNLILQKRKLETDLKSPDLEQHPHLKSRLKHRIKQLEDAIEFYKAAAATNRTTIKTNIMETAATFLPLDLSGKDETQAQQALDKRTEDIKKTLDSHVVHGFDLFNQGNPNYEARDERPQYPLMPNSIIPSFIPVPQPDISIYDKQKQKLAADIAEATASCGTASPESFFIEIAQLVAKDGTTENDISDALSKKSYFPNAFKTLDEEDLKDLREAFFKEVKAHRAIADAVKTDMSNAGIPNDGIRAAVDAGFATRVRAHQQHP